MSLKSSQNYEYQFSANLYDGKLHKVYKNSNNEYFIIIDGRTIRIDNISVWNAKDETNNYPKKLANYYDKLLEKNKEKIDYLEQMKDNIKSKLKAAKSEFNSFLASIGVSKYNEITDGVQRSQAKELRSNIYDLESEKISNSNRYYSACMTSFNYALEKGNWENQIAFQKAFEV